MHERRWSRQEIRFEAYAELAAAIEAGFATEVVAGLDRRKATPQFGRRILDCIDVLLTETFQHQVTSLL